MTPEDKAWSLFLDRDGVINERIPDGYVRHSGEFDFLPGVLESLGTLNGMFSHIFIVTNQQGIGKNLMTTSDLEHLHSYLMDKVITSGGRIDGIYFAESLAARKPYHRKPNPGMALQAKQDVPGLQFHRSVLVGDSQSDISFGKNLGMITVGVRGKVRWESVANDPDFIVDDLPDFTRSLASDIVAGE